MKSVSPLGPRPRTTNPEEVTAMKGTMSAATVHKQYNEVVSAFRRLIADPALRARFDGEADGYFRRCALGVWQADNASAITPRHVEFYNAVYSAGNPVPSALYWEVATGVAGFDKKSSSPPPFLTVSGSMTASPTAVCPAPSLTS